jgi:hypothetical protein
MVSEEVLCWCRWWYAAGNSVLRPGTVKQYRMDVVGWSRVVWVNMMLKA